MVTRLVTRHAGALAWARAEGVEVDEVLEQLDPAGIAPGDVVIGSLPVHIAAQVCERGGRYLHLRLDLPRQARGRELTADEMRGFGARLEEYEVRRVQ